MTPIWSDEVERRIQEQAHSLDRQERPSEVKHCKTCVVSNQRPRIVIDEEGICSACRFAERKRSEIDWAARERELVKLLDQYRRPSGFDVVVPVSGGKDSSFVAHQLKHEYGMTPLCVKFAPFLYTDIGRKNFEAFVQSGFDVIEARPNTQTHRKLSRIAFEYYGDAFQPFVYGQLALPMTIANRYGIGLVFYGENGEAEYGGDQSANDKPCWSFDDWDRVYTKGAGVNRLFEIGQKVGAFDGSEDTGIYKLPPRDFLVQRNTQFQWMGYYKRWHPQANYYYAVENCGFEPNAERSEGTYSKYASLDDKLDGFHYFMAYVKFGLGRATSDAAHEVRDGDRDLEEARALVARYDGEFPKRYFVEFKDYLGLTDEQFWRVVERFRGPSVSLACAA